MAAKAPNRTAVHQLNIRLTDEQFAKLTRACQVAGGTYPPTVPRFVLTEALAAADRLLGGKSVAK